MITRGTSPATTIQPPHKTSFTLPYPTLPPNILPHIPLIPDLPKLYNHRKLLITLDLILPLTIHRLRDNKLCPTMLKRMAKLLTLRILPFPSLFSGAKRKAVGGRKDMMSWCGSSFRGEMRVRRVCRCAV
jgi:hypothetical protein